MNNGYGGNENPQGFYEAPNNNLNISNDSNNSNNSNNLKSSQSVRDALYLLFIAVFAVGIFGILNIYVSLAAIVTCIVFTAISMRRSRLLVGAIILEVAAAVILGINLGGTCLSIVAFTAVSAVYIVTSEKLLKPSLIVTAAAVLAYGGAYLLTSSPITALAVICPIPGMISLVIATKRQLARSYSVALVTIGFLISAVIGAGAVLYGKYGPLSPELLSDLINSARDEWFKNYLLSLDYKDYIPTLEESQKVFDKDTAELIATYVFNIIPGMVVMLLSFIAFFAQRFLLQLTIAFGLERTLTPEMLKLRMSPVSGAVFLISSFVNVIAALGSSDGAALTATVAMNIMLILQAGLVITGMGIFIERMRVRGRGPGLFTWIIGISVAMFMPPAILLILADYGAVMVIIKEVKENFRPGSSGNNR